METADVSILVVHLYKQKQGVLIESIIIHTIIPTNALILKLYFLHTVYDNSDIRGATQKFGEFKQGAGTFCPMPFRR
jgi:hypothetical protein